jgi:hypothetical protein
MIRWVVLGKREISSESELMSATFGECIKRNETSLQKEFKMDYALASAKVNEKTVENQYIIIFRLREPKEIGRD